MKPVGTVQFKNQLPTQLQPLVKLAHNLRWSWREEAKQLAQELSELFATGELSAEDMDAIMFVMHRAYFQYREEKREKEKHEQKEA